MADWATEQERRIQLIRSAYRNYLGRDEPDTAGLQYWLDQSQVLNNDQKLVEAIAYAGRGQVQPQPSLESQVLADPEYASWFRQMGLRESEAQGALAAAREAALRRVGAQRSMFSEQQRQAVRNVDDNAEARGMFRSGGRLQELSRVGTEFDRQRSAYETSVADSLAEAERNTASQIADLRRQNAERIVQTRDRLTRSTIGAPLR